MSWLSILSKARRMSVARCTRRTAAVREWAMSWRILRAIRGDGDRIGPLVVLDPRDRRYRPGRTPTLRVRGRVSTMGIQTRGGVAASLHPAPLRAASVRLCLQGAHAVPPHQSADRAGRP